MKHLSTILSMAAIAAISNLAVAQGDECAGALPVTAGTYGPFTNSGATTTLPWPCALGGNDLWFVAVANATGTAVFDTCGSGFDTCVEVLDGTGGCGGLVSLGCSDDFCSLQSSVTVNVTNGQLLFIRVGGYNGQIGTFSLNASGNLGPVGNFASAAAYGVGCYKNRDSFFENFATSASFDLSNTGFTMMPTGTGYLTMGAMFPWLAPTATALNLGIGDDAEVMVNLTIPFPHSAGTTPSLAVCSNGFVSVATGNGTGYTPNATTHIMAANTAWRNWHDYNPTLGGAVWFEEVGTIAVITWDNVPDYGNAASSNTFQMQFDCATGMVTMLFQNMSLGGNGRLVGYSVGGPSLSPDPLDLSVAIPATFQVQNADSAELVLTASARPVIGSSLTLDSANVPATAVGGLQVLSFVQLNPGVDLGSVGMPGCSQYLGFDIVFPITPSGGTASFPGTVPNSPSLSGFHVFAQSAMLVPGVNTLGAISSNGIDLKLDIY